MDDATKEATPAPPGIFDAVKGLLTNSLHLLHARLQLAALELSEVRATLLQLSVLFGLALLAGWFALAFGSATVIYLCWEAWGWKILLLLAVLFAIGALALGLYAGAVVRRGKLGLPDTLAELKADRDMLL